MLIYLNGFMGSGKTYLGKLWADANNLHFVDLDKLIEQAEQKTISEIFELYGEQYFRQAEQKTLHATSQFKNTIIACGGGTACFYNNLDWMKQRGFTVFLQQDIEAIYQHVLPQKNSRPLLAKLNDADLLSFLQNKYAERLPFYKECQLILSKENLNQVGFKLILQAIQNA
jgi:shikimate kinase